MKVYLISTHGGCVWHESFGFQLFGFENGLKSCDSFANGHKALELPRLPRAMEKIDFDKWGKSARASHFLCCLMEVGEYELLLRGFCQVMCSCEIHHSKAAKTEGWPLWTVKRAFEHCCAFENFETWVRCPKDGFESARVSSSKSKSHAGNILAKSAVNVLKIVSFGRIFSVVTVLGCTRSSIPTLSDRKRLMWIGSLRLIEIYFKISRVNTSQGERVSKEESCVGKWRTLQNSNASYLSSGSDGSWPQQMYMELCMASPPPHPQNKYINK